MSQVYLTIDSLETLMAFLQEAKNAGLLKDVSLAQVRHLFERKAFPLQIPVDLSAVLNVAGNAVVRKTFGKKIEQKTVDILNSALGLS